jgi:hypothetical protein
MTAGEPSEQQAAVGAPQEEISKSACKPLHIFFFSFFFFAQESR